MATGQNGGLPQLSTSTSGDAPPAPPAVFVEPPPSVAEGTADHDDSNGLPADTDDTTPALAPGTFSSILPGVGDLLELIYGIADGSDVSNEDVVNKAKEVAAQIAAMKAAAMALPGGHLGNDAVSAVTDILQDEADRRRAVLQQFVDTPTPVADQVAATTPIPTGTVTPAP